MAYQYPLGGPGYQYMIGPADGSGDFEGPPTVIVSVSAISETNLESIATILAGGTPPSGWQIQADNVPVTTKTY
jgi:hypothetical protein